MQMITGRYNTQKLLDTAPTKLVNVRDEQNVGILCQMSQAMKIY